MPFTVFPDASAGPLSLGPGQISAPLTFPETTGVTSEGPAVFLRIVMLGDGCAPPGDPDPTFQLRANQGPPQELPYDMLTEGWRFVYDQSEPTGDYVAKAKVFRVGENVYAIKILIRRSGSTWQLRIRNLHDVERKFTWVVADTEPESAQPWMNLPQTLSFDGLVSQDVTKSLEVRNLGTGPLTMSLGGLIAGSKFKLDHLPMGVYPNGCGKLIITFPAPTSAGTTQELYTGVSNDQYATDSAHHNNRIRLIARTTGRPEGDPTDPRPEIGRCMKPGCPCLDFYPSIGEDRCMACGHKANDHRRY